MTTNPNCAPDGQHCPNCNGIHNGPTGAAFVTSRTWGDDHDDHDDQD